MTAAALPPFGFLGRKGLRSDGSWRSIWFNLALGRSLKSTIGAAGVYFPSILALKVLWNYMESKDEEIGLIKKRDKKDRECIEKVLKQIQADLGGIQKCFDTDFVANNPGSKLCIQALASCLSSVLFDGKIPIVCTTRKDDSDCKGKAARVEGRLNAIIKDFARNHCEGGEPFRESGECTINTRPEGIAKYHKSDASHAYGCALSSNPKHYTGGGGARIMLCRGKKGDTPISKYCDSPESMELLRQILIHEAAHFCVGLHPKLKDEYRVNGVLYDKCGRPDASEVHSSYARCFGLKPASVDNIDGGQFE